MARKFNVDLTEILTGTAPKLDTYHLVRRGETEEVEPVSPGITTRTWPAATPARSCSRCWSSWIRATSRPSWCATTARSSTTCWKGSLILTFGDRDIQLNAGDSIYFNPTYPHGQRCNGDVPCKFITIIAE